MTVQEQIDRYISEQSPSKSEELRDLHRRILGLSPSCKLWFLDGLNGEGKVVSNPNIGYGSQQIKYVGGETREFYDVGLSANSTGISVYIIGLEDKAHLSKTYGEKLGKAKITGYCVKFKSIKDIDIGVLDEMIAGHMARGPTRAASPRPQPARVPPELRTGRARCAYSAPGRPARPGLRPRRRRRPTCAAAGPRRSGRSPGS